MVSPFLALWSLASAPDCANGYTIQHRNAAAQHNARIGKAALQNLQGLPGVIVESECNYPPRIRAWHGMHQQHVQRSRAITTATVELCEDPGDLGLDLIGRCHTLDRVDMLALTVKEDQRHVRQTKSRLERCAVRRFYVGNAVLERCVVT